MGRFVRVSNDNAGHVRRRLHRRDHSLSIATGGCDAAPWAVGGLLP